MAEPAKAEIFAAIDAMASDLKATWDSPLNWAATTDALIDLIVVIGDELDPRRFSTLVAAAAMARRQALRAPAEPTTVEEAHG